MPRGGTAGLLSHVVSIGPLARGEACWGWPVGGGGLRLSAGKNRAVPSASIGDMVPGASLPTLALSVSLSQMQSDH